MEASKLDDGIASNKFQPIEFIAHGRKVISLGFPTNSFVLQLSAARGFKYPFFLKSTFAKDDEEGDVDWPSNPTDMKGLLEDIADMKKVLDFVDNEDLDLTQFDELHVELAPWVAAFICDNEWKKKLKSRGLTKETMTMKDWRSYIIDVGHLVLVDMRLFFLSALIRFKEGKEKIDILLKSDKNAHEARKEQFQQLMNRTLEESNCYILKAYATTCFKRQPCYPLVSEVLWLHGLLVLFELIIEGAKLFDSLEDMKKWVKKKIEEGHISQIVFDNHSNLVADIATPENCKRIKYTVSTGTWD